jgi:hypothetical protein
MDYIESEMEARIFPSVDVDPMDLIYDDWVIDTESDCETEEEPDCDESWMDADALASAGWGTDEDYGGYGGDDY